jgi:cyanophycinase
MHVTLVGGGRRPAAFGRLYGPFLERATLCAGAETPQIAVVLIDEGQDLAADRYLYEVALRAVGRCELITLGVTLGSQLRAVDFAAAHGLLVGGGLTPAYADAVVPAKADILGWLIERGAPYCGFSAGASIAARDAVVGGWLVDGQPVCPPDAGEDLDEVTVVPGLGLVEFSVDVHATQWGTTPRLAAAVDRLGDGHRGFAIDEDTAVIVDDGAEPKVVGLGHATQVGSSVR